MFRMVVEMLDQGLMLARDNVHTRATAHAIQYSMYHLSAIVEELTQILQGNILAPNNLNFSVLYIDCT